MTHRYLLGAITHSSSFETPDSNGAGPAVMPMIRDVRRLTEPEWVSFQGSVQMLAEFAQADRLYELFDRNVHAFFFFLNEVLEHQADARITSDDLFGLLIEVDRHLLNILTAMRTFLDHSETRLKRGYGHASTEFESFKRACANEYDKHFCQAAAPFRAMALPAMHEKETLWRQRFYPKSPWRTMSAKPPSAASKSIGQCGTISIK